MNIFDLWLKNVVRFSIWLVLRCKTSKVSSTFQQRKETVSKAFALGEPYWKFCLLANELIVILFPMTRFRWSGSGLDPWQTLLDRCRNPSHRGVQPRWLQSQSCHLGRSAKTQGHRGLSCKGVRSRYCLLVRRRYCYRFVCFFLVGVGGFTYCQLMLLHGFVWRFAGSGSKLPNKIVHVRGYCMLKCMPNDLHTKKKKKNEKRVMFLMILQWKSASPYTVTFMLF